MPLIEVWRTTALIVLAAGCGVAVAQSGPTTSEGGHEEQVMVDPTLHRFTGTVTAIGKADAQGHVYSFGLSPVGPQTKPPKPDEFRGWRMTVLTGKRFSKTFEISGNTLMQASVVASKGSIDGMAAHDMFIIESIDAAGHSMFAPAAAASAATSGG
jgi:hypothetical protein